MENCDTLLIVGSSFPYAEWLPPEGAARGIQIDLDATRIGLRYPMDVHLVGDARETLLALLPPLQSRPAQSWRQWIEQRVTESVQRDPAARRRRGGTVEPGASGSRTQSAPSGSCDPYRGFRFVDDLVGPKRQGPRRDARLGLRRPCVDGMRSPLRDRSQDGTSRSARDRVPRRWRLPDERHERAHHCRHIPQIVGRPTTCLRSLRQPRPQHGQLGTTDARRRPRTPTLNCFPISPSPNTRTSSAYTRSDAPTPTTSAEHGPKRWRPTGRR